MKKNFKNKFYTSNYYNADNYNNNYNNYYNKNYDNLNENKSYNNVNNKYNNELYYDNTYNNSKYNNSNNNNNNYNNNNYNNSKNNKKHYNNKYHNINTNQNTNNNKDIYENNRFDNYKDDQEDFYLEDCYDDEFENQDYTEEDTYDDSENYNDNYLTSKKYESNNRKNPLEFNSNIGFTESIINNIISNEFNKSTFIPQSVGYLNILMIAEKPSIAKAISTALSGNKKINSKQLGRGKPLYTFDGSFSNNNIRAKFHVSSVMGHVFTSDFRKEHNSWNSIEPVDLFDAPIVKFEANKKTRIVGLLNKLAVGKDIIILWLDCDKEGENICFETIYCCYNIMNKHNFRQIYRAKFSSLTNSDLRKAFNNIKDMPNYKESTAVDARQHIDLKIGIAFTRFLTMTISPGLANYGNLNVDSKTQKKGRHGNNTNSNYNLISYGPCQTPTLWFCVNREEEIKNFISKQMFNIYVEIIHLKHKYKIYLVPSKSKILNNNKNSNVIFDKNGCNKVLEHLKKQLKNNANVSANNKNINNQLSEMNLQDNVTSNKCKLINVSINKSFKSAPVGLNTVNMLRTASSFLKISPHNCMILAEKLYTSGFITYPRTESTKYPVSFNFIEILDSLSNSSELNSEIKMHCKNLLKNFIKPVLRGVDVGDHPPITPCSKNPSNLTRDMSRLYEFICLHYIATLSNDAEYEDRLYTFMLGDEIFEESSKRLVKEGFIHVFKHKKQEQNCNFPEFKNFDSSKDNFIDVALVNYDSTWTNPPPLLTESELIKLMEENKIGTDASMAVHIENIVTRGYVTVDENRKLKSTNLGKALINSLRNVDKDLVIPNLRAQIENFVEEIAKGKSSYHKIMDYSLNLYKNKLITVRQRYNDLLKGFSQYFSLSHINLNNIIKKIKTSNEIDIVNSIKEKE